MGLKQALSGELARSGRDKLPDTGFDAGCIQPQQLQYFGLGALLDETIRQAQRQQRLELPQTLQRFAHGRTSPSHHGTIFEGDKGFVA